MINNRVILCDVSFWQDANYTPYKIDFSVMQSKGMDGVIIRAGQNLWVDEDFKDYVHNVKATTLPWGIYWFYDSRTSPVPQADIFADLVESVGFPPLGIWGDFEERYNGNWKGAINYYAFMHRLTQRFPNKLVGVYTAPSYWEEMVSSTSYVPLFRDFPLWMAHYKVDEPTILPPWTSYILWQYTSAGNGYFFGVESKELDMDLFYGTLEDYKTFFNLPDYVPTEPQQQGEDGMYKVWSETTPLTLRQTNTATGTRIVGVPAGIVMTADRIEPPISGGLPGDLWAHGDVTINGAKYTGWMAVIHMGIVYCKTEEINPPAPGTLPVLTVTLEAPGYPTTKIEWKPN